MPPPRRQNDRRRSEAADVKHWRLYGTKTPFTPRFPLVRALVQAGFARGWGGSRPRSCRVSATKLYDAHGAPTRSRSRAPIATSSDVQPDHARRVCGTRRLLHTRQMFSPADPHECAIHGPWRTLVRCSAPLILTSVRYAAPGAHSSNVQPRRAPRDRDSGPQTRSRGTVKPADRRKAECDGDGHAVTYREQTGAAPREPATGMR